jgi:hypothetical protein
VKKIRGKTKSNLPPDWHEFFDAKIHGRAILPGTEVSIIGKRGRFRFVRRIVKDDGSEWLDFWGGKKGVESWRSFTPESIKTVHRLRQTAKSLLEDRT